MMLALIIALLFLTVGFVVGYVAHMCKMKGTK